MTWDKDLTEEQCQAASHIGSHARLLAGPGTGKTRVLTRRVLYLVQERGVDPANIMVLTFTRAARAELKRRIAQELGEDADRIIISTLHSYALRMLLQYGAGDRLPTPIRIADDFEERYIIEEDLKVILQLPRVLDARDLLHQLSADWAQMADNPGSRLPNPRFLGAWQEHRQIFGYTLRAELVYQLRHALEEGAINPNSIPKYILVDEYQDLNPCDLAVIKSLAERGAELYVAGDDDQSIYGFRYAEPDGIRRFPRDYPSSTSLELRACWRCSPEILNLAQYVINQDPRRIPKTLNSAPSLPSGEVHLLHFPDQEKEAIAIAQICKWLVGVQRIPPEEILILVRTDLHGKFSAPIRDTLQSIGLPVGVVADPLTPLYSEEGRQFLSILQLTVNLNDHLAWRTLLQLRKNGIGEKSLRELYDYARIQGIGFADTVNAAASDKNLFPRFYNNIAREVMTIRQLVEQANQILQSEDLISAITQLARKLIEHPQNQQDVIELFTSVAKISAPENLEMLLRAVNVSLGEAEQERQAKAINIMTMHQAKGLTAEAVFIVAAEDEYIPGRAQGVAVEDERRLLYVSLTRARRYLYITHCHQRVGQQSHTGRNPNTQRRSLTRFLRGGPVSSQNGEEFIRRSLGSNV